MNPEHALDIASEAAVESGSLLMNAFQNLEAGQISLKGMGDYVTDLDLRSEELIKRKIRQAFPGHRIVAEESGSELGTSPYTWYIDPLDGTANFVQGIAVFSVSIALSFEGKMIMGVVYDPYREEMFRAVRGGGAHVNDKPIHVSAKQDLQHAMIATGFPWRAKDHLDAYIESFRRIFVKSAGVRRMGSAAIDLAYTACGRFDGFWEMKLHSWDIAAGALLVREAGGMIDDFRGEGHYLESGNVVAGNPDIGRQILEITKKYLSGVD